MPTAPQWGDHLWDLVYKANKILQPVVPGDLYMEPKWGMHLWDLVNILDQNIANISITGTPFKDQDLDDLPTSDPGGGKPWLNGGVVQVGP